MADAYGGLFGAYRYAFRQSASWLFRSYVLVSALAGAYVALVLALALITWLASPTGLIGEHALIGVVGVLVLGPLFAPVLIVARRHRRSAAAPVAQRLFALAGYAFLGSVFLALFITDPNDHAVAGPLRALIAALDALPRLWGLVPPVLAAGLIALVARLTRPGAAE